MRSKRQREGMKMKVTLRCGVSKNVQEITFELETIRLVNFVRWSCKIKKKFFSKPFSKEIHQE